MTRKPPKPETASAKRSDVYRPHNALNAGVASREGWAGSAGKGSRNPRARKPKKRS